MTTVFITPPNPYDFELSELTELAETLQTEDRNSSIQVKPQSERGYGADATECIDLLIFIGGASAKGALGYASGVVVKKTIEWARDRWKRDREENTGLEPRPRMVRVIWGPNGEVIRRVSIDLPDGEPVDTDSDRPS
ncbi:hypothetical protein [Actinacidiphila acididurans]|uniref:Uncharacterized protein n=1 Tax=Actinacidiphila acididurans TaxID=2784346 RepID=A0ABS2TNX1_9ACTN|nr:hypothetical protein [Actinacidiphila acididurans]MBM9505035.1 hypothetical protein [Actinacidiphila acididurans]